MQIKEMQIKDLIRLLKEHDEDAKVESLVNIDGVDYDLKIEGVGTIEDDEVIYVYSIEK